MEHFAEEEFARWTIHAELREAPVAGFAADRPAGDGLGEGGDVRLRVTAVDAERVQLEDLARQVLVDVEFAPTLRIAAALQKTRGARIRADRRLVVEVQQHRRVLLDREQQIREMPGD